MRQYGLSAQRVTRVIRNPERTEVGIVENTIAVMQPSSIKYKNFKKIWSQEIWVMYQISARGGKVKSSKLKVQSKIPNSKFQKLQTTNKKLKIISAWRYPGISPKNNPIPGEILREIRTII